MKQALANYFKTEFKQHVAFFVVVAVAALTMIFMRETPYGFLELLVFGLLHLFYVAFGLLGYAVLAKVNPTLAVWAYFIVMFAVGILIQYMGKFAGAFWILLLPLVGSAVAFAPGFGTVVVGVAVVLVQAALVSIYNNYNFSFFVPNVVGFGSAVLFVAIFASVANEADKARSKVEQLAAELGEANRQLREYALQVEELATIRERNRLAREIHDSLGHYLTVVNVQIEAARVMLTTNPAKAEENLSKAQTLAREGLAEVRRSVAALRSAPTESKPLTDLLQNLVEETRKAGIVADFRVSGEPRPLDPQAEHALYRAAQEGLTNVRKHANASRVKLCLDYDSGSKVSLQVEDNGVGTDKTDGGFGLLGMRERVQLLGGKLQTYTEKGKGFRLEVELPS
jgi:signal transduction histidine kinase